MNTTIATDDREFRILELLSSGQAATQRQVANASGLSLGFVNAVVRRLARTGHLKIHNLTAKKFRYMLTPKGIAEKSRRSYDYVKRTLRTYNTCLERIGQLIAEQAQAGRKRFVVVGEGDLAELVVVALQLRVAAGIRFERRTRLNGAAVGADACVLNCGEPRAADIGISVLSELLNVGLDPSKGKL